jgi:hypothetical protein
MFIRSHFVKEGVILCSRGGFGIHRKYLMPFWVCDLPFSVSKVRFYVKSC